MLNPTPLDLLSMVGSAPLLVVGSPSLFLARVSKGVSIFFQFMPRLIVSSPAFLKPAAIVSKDSVCAPNFLAKVAIPDINIPNIFNNHPKTTNIGGIKAFIRTNKIGIKAFIRPIIIGNILSTNGIIAFWICSIAGFNFSNIGLSNVITIIDAPKPAIPLAKPPRPLAKP